MKTIEQLQEQINELQKQIDELKNSEWPKDGDGYYHIDPQSAGVVAVNKVIKNTMYDKMRYATRNMFKTREEAERYAELIPIAYEYRRAAEKTIRNSDDVYYIPYLYNDDIRCLYCRQDVDYGLIKWHDLESLQIFIDAHKDDMADLIRYGLT